MKGRLRRSYISGLDGELLAGRSIGIWFTVFGHRYAFYILYYYMRLGLSSPAGSDGVLSPSAGADGRGRHRGTCRRTRRDPGVHYLDVFHAVLFSAIPVLLILAGRRLDAVHDTRAIYRSRNGTSQGYGSHLLYGAPAVRTKIIAACHLVPPLQHPGVQRTKRKYCSC